MSKIKQLLDSLHKEATEFAPQVLASLEELRDDITAALASAKAEVKPIEIDIPEGTPFATITQLLKEVLGVDVKVVDLGDLLHEAKTECEQPPAGWACSRTNGHEGPCAATAEKAPLFMTEEESWSVINDQDRLLADYWQRVNAAEEQLAIQAKLLESVQARVTNYHEGIVSALELIGRHDVLSAKSNLEYALKASE